MRIFALKCAAIAALAFGQPISAEPPQGMIETIERVAPGIWSIHQRQPFHLQPVGNVEVIDQKGGLVLIDGGGSPGSARRIAQLVKSVSSKPVIAIAITHWHGDHSLGVATLLKTWPGAEVIATNATRDHILGASMKRYPKGAPDEAMTKSFLGAIAPVLESFRKSSLDPAVPAAVRSGYASTLDELTVYEEDIAGVFLPSKISGFETERVLDDPVRPVQLRFIGRGNTDGDLVGWLPRQRILATGDLVVAPIPFGFDCYPASWQSDLDKLIALHARTIIPGHGLPMRDGSYLKLLRDMLADLRGRMAVIGPKEDMDQATKDLAPAFTHYQDRFAGNDQWLQSWFVKYWQKPVSEALWKEARGIPIDQGGG